MELSQFRNETSERSDPRNWAKRLLIERTTLHYDSIEGCNQNNQNVVTHLMERARVTITGTGEVNTNAAFASIKQLEGDDNKLLRKIRFANCFGKPLTYVLYCNENENVFVFTITSLNDITLQRSFTTYQSFSNWIAEIKGWVSRKAFREDGLPQFDIILRRAGTAWPTNIDCFISNAENIPCAILEFQNTKDALVRNHCNNDWFLCRSIQYNDIRRWTSQEILRVQSNLRFFIITWSANEPNFIFKRVNKITIPDLPYPDMQAVGNYQSALSAYINNNRSQERFDRIANNYSTFNFSYEQNQMRKLVHRPPLTVEAQTFPFIYYTSKEYVENNQNRLIELSNNFVN